MPSHVQRSLKLSVRFSNLHLINLAPRSVKLNSNTIIIIAVCASAGAVILAFILWKVIRVCLSTPVPLPPIQPLAHHREQRQEYPANNRSRFAAHRRTHLRAEASYSSLLPSYQPSVRTDSVAHAPDSACNSDSYLSSPSFQRQDYGLGSLQGGHDSGLLGSVESLGFPDTSTSTTPLSPGNQSQHSLAPSPLGTSSRLQPFPSLQSSAVSHASTSPTSSGGRHNKNTIRGFPHSPYNSIQIVLPAPLAPQVYGAAAAAASKEDLRNSYVDKWALAPNRSISLRSDSERPTTTLRSPLSSQHLSPSNPGSNSGSFSIPSVPPLPLARVQQQPQQLQHKDSSQQQSHSPEDPPDKSHTVRRAPGRPTHPPK